MSLPIGSYTQAVITYLDKTAEKSRFKVYGTNLTAANFDDQIDLFDALVLAAGALVLGQQIAIEYGAKQTEADPLPGTNLAQREDKFLISYRDAVTGKRLSSTLPTAKLAAITYEPNSTEGYIVLADGGVVAAFVTAFEAFAIAPLTGNATEILSIRYKGKNN